MAPVPALLWRSLRTHQVYGANTDVGKTIFSTILCNSAVKRGDRTWFLKPVSTGAANEADGCHIQRYAPSTNHETLFQYDIPCSPHIAAKASGKPIPSDEDVLAKIYDTTSRYASEGPGWLFLETAGGVHSPGPSGTTQADLYAPLRAPVVLVGDSKLGGISQTISAYESLRMRGHDIESILLFQDMKYENYQYLRDYFARLGGISVDTVPEPPSRLDNEKEDIEQMKEYYASSNVDHVLEALDKRGKERISRLESMSSKASKSIWYPFTQQKLVTADTISAIDSAHGDYFQVLNPKTPSLLQPAFDGSASWWSQGLGHANSRLTLAAAYAAGRYGHVMFAEAIHEPALALAEMLLKGANNPRFSRVFYSDNGSTGCEVAVKMALRAARLRYGWGPNDNVHVLGLKGSYHGDTIGAMDCAEPCVYNEKIEWYEGKWVVQVPDGLRDELGQDSHLKSISEVFDLESRLNTEQYRKYERYIEGVLSKLQASGRKFGALMMEPIILGAGGMIFVDPLFQRALVDVVRRSPHLFGNGSSPKDPLSWSGLPVIFDEVFTGLYRLGRFTAASFLGTDADISVNAKLLTGGLVPLCTTMASESIFDAFVSDDKSDALLHGHSYTAHAVGCQVAVESVREMQDMEKRGEWEWAESDWETDTQAWSVWSREFVNNVSHNQQVLGVWALGSVLAISLRDDDGVGYKSLAAKKLQTHLREGTGTWNAHSRVLGNVFYVMASQKTSRQSLQELQGLLLGALNTEMSSKQLYEKTREQSISDFEAQTKDLQKEYPDVDFKAVVIEPTMNLMFDIKENLTEDERKRHEEYITRMLQNTGNPSKAEKYLWQARDYLRPYPDVLKQFDDIYINQRPIPSPSAMNSNNPNLFTDVDLLDGFISDDLTPYMSDSAPPTDLSNGMANLAPTHPAPQNPFTPLSLHGYTQQATPAPPAKVGGRFTRESVRILKNWLATHQNHPYPREPERRMLQEETGLTKTQISNWLANARRRGKIPSSASSPRHGDTPAMDIPPRPGTPAVRNTSDMDPLQRWVDSPPEDEPAAVTAIARAVASVRPQSAPRKAFQCTFCTETFRAKHDWQRHENSLHLPLERWVCSPEGPRGQKADSPEIRCVFCGHVDPDDAHIETHNYSACKNRPVQERTFNRKDHLNQHLKLVHNAKFAEWPMRQWKAPPPAIHSRCGFCNLVMETWIDRVHHLADHFKTGKTMADWKGDWGFEPHILELVENSIPPYFIETERNSPFPFEGSRALVETPRTAYELLKLELAYFMQNHFYKHARMPTGDEMQLEACRILFAAEPLSHGDLVCPSWLRDLVFSNVQISQQAQFGPMRSNAESRLSSLEISGKNNIFEGCPFETQLQEFVQAKQLLGLSIRDDELREECCRIVGRLEEVSATPSDFIANWLIKIIHLPGDWLLPFRQRTGIELIGLSEGMNLNAMIQDYTRLEQELGAYLDLQRVIGIEPPDDDLRRQARVIIHGSDSNLNHTAADDDYWLAAFRQRHSTTTETSEAWNTPLRPDPHLLAARGLVLKTSTAFLNDHNYWRWFTQELRRWVTGIMSPHNPASRVPSDEEIQHYARWISYNEYVSFLNSIC
ncbi:pyridoxal phosphate-dependent transferase [Fusarium oxysporum]|nr:pyridoxal phosphate-dependent transferase [Fusarium oxysporum]